MKISVRLDLLSKSIDIESDIPLKVPLRNPNIDVTDANALLKDALGNIIVQEAIDRNLLGDKITPKLSQLADAVRIMNEIRRK